MGKITIITPEQELLLKAFQNNAYTTSHFYFTGGTALSLYYLQHRESIDLDFFSENIFNPDDVIAQVNLLAKTINFSVEYSPIDNNHIFNLTFTNKAVVKVDFVYHNFKRVEKSEIKNNLEIDSMLDIAINKLLTIMQRSEVKDFVDLYFLLQSFSLWDLIEGVRIKYKIKIEPYILGSDFSKVENFDFLPKMIKPLNLEDLQLFFIEKAKELGKTAVE